MQHRAMGQQVSHCAFLQTYVAWTPVGDARSQNSYLAVPQPPEDRATVLEHAQGVDLAVDSWIVAWPLAFGGSPLDPEQGRMVHRGKLRVWSSRHKKG